MNYQVSYLRGISSTYGGSKPNITAVCIQTQFSYFFEVTA